MLIFELTLPVVRVVAELRGGVYSLIIVIDSTAEEIQRIGKTPEQFRMFGKLMVGVSAIDECTRVIADKADIDNLTRLLGEHIGATARRALAGLEAIPGIDDPEEWQRTASICLELELTLDLLEEIVDGFVAHANMVTAATPTP